MAPPDARHGALVPAIIARLSPYVTERRVGVVFAETGFILSADPPTVRGPDIAVVLAERVPTALPVGFSLGPPDLANRGAVTR